MILAERLHQNSPIQYAIYVHVIYVTKATLVSQPN